MAEWMYAHSLQVEDHPKGCTCGGCDGVPEYEDDVEEFEQRDDTCSMCNGTGDDYEGLGKCPKCDGEGFYWWL
jgi:DnaJ-class molecular chaperone